MARVELRAQFSNRKVHRTCGGCQITPPTPALARAGDPFPGEEMLEQGWSDEDKGEGWRKGSRRVQDRAGSLSSPAVGWRAARS